MFVSNDIYVLVAHGIAFFCFFDSIDLKRLSGQVNESRL